MTRAKEIADSTGMSVNGGRNRFMTREEFVAALESYAQEERERCAKQIVELWPTEQAKWLAARIQEGQQQPASKTDLWDAFCASVKQGPRLVRWDDDIEGLQVQEVDEEVMPFGSSTELPVTRPGVESGSGLCKHRQDANTCPHCANAKLPPDPCGGDGTYPYLESAGSGQECAARKALEGALDYIRDAFEVDPTSDTRLGETCRILIKGLAHPCRPALSREEAENIARRYNEHPEGWCRCSRCGSLADLLQRVAGEDKS